MRQMRVTAEPRAYLISVAITASDPGRTVKLASPVVAAYLRTQKLKVLAEAQSAAEHDLVDAYTYTDCGTQFTCAPQTRLGSQKTRFARSGMLQCWKIRSNWPQDTR